MTKEQLENAIRRNTAQFLMMLRQLEIDYKINRLEITVRNGCSGYSVDVRIDDIEED